MKRIAGLIAVCLLACALQAHAQHSATLAWTSPNPSTPYRGTVSGGPYTALISAPQSASTYTDATVQAGQTYYYVVTDTAGGIESGFSNEVMAAIPGAPPPPPPANSVFQRFGASASYTDPSGNVWKPGTCSGSTYTNSHAIGGTTTQPLYQAECYGNSFTIKITGLTAGAAYTATAKFSELYWSKTGGRVFSVKANGVAWITNLDIFKEVGQYAADDKTTDVTADSTGAVTFAFTTSADNAKIDALSLVPSGPPPPVVTLGISGAWPTFTLNEMNIPSGTAGTVTVTIGGATASAPVTIP